MLAAKIAKKTFAGGYRFRPFVGQPGEKIDKLSIPERVTLARPEALQPLVTKGQTVTAGEIIARNDESVSSPVLATISGTVDSVGGGEIVIVSDGSDQWNSIDGHSTEWRNLDPGRLEEVLYTGGVTALAPNGIPTRFASSPVSVDEVEHIIVHHIEDEPYAPSAKVLLGGDGMTRAQEGLEILGRIMSAAKLHVALDLRNRKLLESWAGEIHRYGLPARYPQSRQEILVPTILGTEFPNGWDAISMGVLLIDLQSVIQVRDAVVDGKPAIERLVALSGPGFTSNPYVAIRGGSPVSTVSGYSIAAPTRVIADSLMVGRTLSPDAPIPLTCRQLISLPDDAREMMGWAKPGFRKDSISRVFAANFLPIARSADTNLHGEHRPCISCGFCDDVCPAGILPHLLHRYVDRGRIDEDLARYGIIDCIDCNLCTYVCPCKIPVAALMVEGKKKVVQEGLVSLEKIRHRFALKGLEAHQPEAEL